MTSLSARNQLVYQSFEQGLSVNRRAKGGQWEAPLRLLCNPPCVGSAKNDGRLRIKRGVPRPREVCYKNRQVGQYKSIK